MDLLIGNFSSDPFLRDKMSESIIVLSARSGHISAKGPFVSNTRHTDLTVALRPFLLREPEINVYKRFLFTISLRIKISPIK